MREVVSRLACRVVGNEQILHNFLRCMTKSNVKNVSKLHENQHGVKRMAGYLNCIHVQWKTVHIHLAGNMWEKMAFLHW